MKFFPAPVSRCFRSLTGMKVGEVWIFDIGVLLLQVVPELHRDIGPVVTSGAVVHLDPFVLPRVQDVLADIFSAV